jgi:hypothetical protein
MKNNKPHLEIKGYTISNKFKSTASSGGKEIYKEVDRLLHGQNLLQKIKSISKNVSLSEIKTTELIRDNSVYIEFSSDWGYKLSFDSFDTSGFRLLNIKENKRVLNGSEEYMYSLVVQAEEGSISKFINKIESYIEKNTTKTDKITKEKIVTDTPENKNF